MKYKQKFADYRALLFGFQLLLLLNYTPPVQAQNNSEVTHIFQLINERLAYMKGVAFYKREAGKPVEDLVREKLVLDKSLARAAEFGLNSDSTKSFFQIQIGAAKAIQHRYQADWLFDPPDEQAVPDLMTDVRPNLIRIGNELVSSIGAYLKSGKHFMDEQEIEFLSALEVHNLSDNEKRKIFKALQQITRR